MTDADIPAVRYLTAPAYTPDDPPPPFKTWWVRPNGLDLEILGQHDVPPDDLIPLGRHVVGSACAHEGTCSDHDLQILGQHIQSGRGDLKLDNLLIAADAGCEVDLYSDFDQDEPTYDGSSLVATLSLSDACQLRDWLTTWLERQ